MIFNVTSRKGDDVNDLDVMVEKEKANDNHFLSIYYFNSHHKHN